MVLEKMELIDFFLQQVSWPITTGKRTDVLMIAAFLIHDVLLLWIQVHCLGLLRRLMELSRAVTNNTVCHDRRNDALYMLWIAVWLKINNGNPIWAETAVYPKGCFSVTVAVCCDVLKQRQTQRREAQEVFKLHQLQLSTGCPSMLVHSCWLLTACYSMSHEPINLLQIARLRITIDFFLFIHHLERFWYGQNTILLKFSLNCWFWQYSFWYFKGPENPFYPQVSMSFVPSRRTEALFQEQFKLT